MRIIFILLVFGLLSCDGKRLEKHSSPNGDYTLQVVFDNSEPNDEHLGFRLLDKNGDEVDYMRTLAGNHMKWAVTWYNDKTIMMDSHDVGLYGWTVDEIEHFKPIDTVSKDMENKCAEAFKAKYGTHSAH